MQHGEKMTSINAEVQAKLLRDHVAGRSGSEALLIAGPDGRGRMGYLEEVFSSQLGSDGEPIGSIFNLVSGAPGELVSSATVGQASSFAGYLERLTAHLSRLPFYLPGRLAHLPANLDLGQRFPAFDVDGLVLQPDGRGGVVVYDPDGGPDLQPDGHDMPPSLAPLADSDGPDADGPDGVLLDQLVDEVRDAGLLPDGPPDVGAAGGRWVPVDPDDVIAADGTLTLAPMTPLSRDVAAGDTYLTINDAHAVGMADHGDWFEPGDRIVLDPGGHNMRFPTVAALGSLLLTTPLTHGHTAGTAILRLTPTDTGTGTEAGDTEAGTADGGDTQGETADGADGDGGRGDTSTDADAEADARPGSSDPEFPGTGLPEGDGDTDGGSTAPDGAEPRVLGVTEVAATTTGSLARTGITIGLLLALAALLLASGSPVLRVGRRRDP